MYNSTNRIVIIDFKEKNKGSLSHMEKCIKILEECMENYQYKLIKIGLTADDEYRANIAELVAALERCIILNPTIISLSIGTIYPFDADVLYPIVRKLTQKGIILVAASSNNGYRTAPAFFSEVIGISEDKNTVAAPALFRLRENEMGIDLIVQHKKLNYKMTDDDWEGNSFVVPVAVAEICKGLLNNKNIDEVLSSFEIKEVDWNKNILFHNKKKLLQRPYVYIEDIALEICEIEEGLHYLHRKYNLDGVFYSRKNFSYSMHCMHYAIAYVDIYFSDTQDYWGVKADIRCQRKHNNTAYIYDDRKISYTTRQTIYQIIDMIVRILPS